MSWALNAAEDLASVWKSSRGIKPEKYWNIDQIKLEWLSNIMHQQFICGIPRLSGSVAGRMLKSQARGSIELLSPEGKQNKYRLSTNVMIWCE